jgi:hypothetical protein
MAEVLFDEATSRRRPSACSTPTFTKAWSASWPAASRTSCTAPPSCLPPAARRARSTNSRARAAPSRLSPARRAGPGGQAPPRRAAAFWRPRHGGRLHHGRRRSVGRVRAGAGQVALEWLDAATLTRRWKPTARWLPEYRRADLVDTLHREVWGQGFAPHPLFSEEVEVVSQRLVGEKHLALKLKHQGQPVDGIWFGHTEPLPAAHCWRSGWMPTNGTRH